MEHYITRRAQPASEASSNFSEITQLTANYSVQDQINKAVRAGPATSITTTYKPVIRRQTAKNEHFTN